ncbi:hypothetical protein ACA910_005189 [Epithemia clementina (nom. ined.)]
MDIVASSSPLFLSHPSPQLRSVVPSATPPSRTPRPCMTTTAFPRPVSTSAEDTAMMLMSMMMRVQSSSLLSNSSSLLFQHPTPPTLVTSARNEGPPRSSCPPTTIITAPTPVFSSSLSSSSAVLHGGGGGGAAAAAAGTLGPGDFSSNGAASAGTTTTTTTTTTLATPPAAVVGGSSPVVVTGRPPIRLYLSADFDSFSTFQVAVRQHVEFFEASEDDITTSAQGRPRPIVLGQVGIRCCFCAHLHPSLRPPGAVCYPSKRAGIYQAAQNIAKVHWMEQCGSISTEFRQELGRRRAAKCPVRRRASKATWTHRATALGVHEDAVKGGLRFAIAVNAFGFPTDERGNGGGGGGEEDILHGGGRRFSTNTAAAPGMIFSPGAALAGARC